MTLVKDLDTEVKIISEDNGDESKLKRKLKINEVVIKNLQEKEKESGEMIKELHQIKALYEIKKSEKVALQENVNQICMEKELLQRKVHTVETVNEDLRKEDKAYRSKKYEMENLKQFLEIGMREIAEIKEEVKKQKLKDSVVKKTLQEKIKVIEVLVKENETG